MVTFRKVFLEEKYLMKQIFELRYQVYTVERSFLPSEKYPDKLETDDFDEQSAHFAALNEEGRVLGAVRMIFTRPQMIPVKKYCPGVSFDSICLTHNAAEISRLVMSKKSRQVLRDEGVSEEEIVIGLCQAMYNECVEEGVTHTFALMEKTLWQLLRRYGFQFHCLGREVDVFGPVKPYVCDVASIEWSEIVPDEIFTPVSILPLEGSLAAV